MVVRTRLRSIVAPIVFYLVLGVASGYLVWGASNGEHGLKAKDQFDAEAVQLKAELAGLKDERARWELRVASLRPKASTGISWTGKPTRSSIGSPRTRW